MPIYDKMILGKKAHEFSFVRGIYEKTTRLNEILRFLTSISDICIPKKQRYRLFANPLFFHI